jgi:hypothetical protein
MLRLVHDVENVLRDAGFWSALLVAGVGVAIVWLRARQHLIEPGIAAVVLVAGFVGLRFNHFEVAQPVTAVVLFGLAEWVFRTRGASARLVAYVLCAATLAATLPDPFPIWARAATGCVVAVGAFTAPVVDARFPRPLPLLLAIGALGAYACGPDTEAQKALVGALVAVAVIGLEPRLRPALGYPAVVALFAWVATWGGLGRPGSIVGSLACLGVVLLPVPRARLVAPRAAVVVLVAVQVALVVYESRVAGFEERAGRALLLTVPAFLLAWLVLLATDRIGRRRTRE